jgi:hypothetical protein
VLTRFEDREGPRRWHDRPPLIVPSAARAEYPVILRSRQEAG